MFVLLVKFSLWRLPFFWEQQWKREHLTFPFTFLSRSKVPSPYLLCVSLPVGQTEVLIWRITLLHHCSKETVCSPKLLFRKQWEMQSSQISQRICTLFLSVLERKFGQCTPVTRHRTQFAAKHYKCCILSICGSIQTLNGDKHACPTHMGREPPYTGFVISFPAVPDSQCLYEQGCSGPYSNRTLFL